ncbi:MAG: TlpA disulfide reductase family protein [Gammaproteobacteria bacterium]
MPSILLILLLLMATLAGAAQPALSPVDSTRAAPDFKLPDIQGKTHALADYRGKVLVVNFWATWCAPCVKEMPSLQRAWEQLRGDRVQVIGINLGEEAADITQFIGKYPIEFPLLLDAEMAQQAAWGLKGLPTTFVVDPNGRIAYTVLGDKNWDDPEILKQIRALQGG